MSDISSSPPFTRGNYSGSGEFLYLEGREFWMEDVSPLSGVAVSRTGRLCKVRLVRNISGINLLPKRLVTFSATAGKYGARVDGYVDTTAEHCYPVDEYLPAAGVPDQSLFYIVVEGPALVLTDLAGGANNLIALGGNVVGLTAATSGATTAGRLAPIDLTGATALLANQIMNRVGRALTARTTANTNADILVDCGRW